jgi:hypothetical protein
MALQISMQLLYTAYLTVLIKIFIQFGYTEKYFPFLQCQGVSIAQSVQPWADDRRLIPGKGKICLFSIASRSAPGPIQPPIQWVLKAISTGLKRPRREADH